jgi:hypothetical protein
MPHYEFLLKLPRSKQHEEQLTDKLLIEEAPSKKKNLITHTVQT